MTRACENDFALTALLLTNIIIIDYLFDYRLYNRIHGGLAYQGTEHPREHFVKLARGTTRNLHEKIDDLQLLDLRIFCEHMNDLGCTSFT